MPRHRLGERLTEIPLLPLLLGSLAACDIPTDLPRWDTRWVVPAASLSIGVGDLLPYGVAVSETREAFDLDLDAFSFSRSLGEICSVCALAEGLTFPKPAFATSFGGSIDLPDALLSAQLIGGELHVRLRHDLSFDPLRPGGSESGFIVLRAVSGSTELARDSISGGTMGLPPGTVVTRVLQLQPANITAPIEVHLALDSPAGSPAHIELGWQFRVEIAAATLQVAEVRVRIGDQPIATPAVDLNLDGIDDWVAERVKDGAVQVEVENPFDISGPFELMITAPDTEIAKVLELSPGASTREVEFTGDELRSILGRPGVRMTISGSVSTPAEGTRVRPADELGLGTRLALTIRSRRE